MLVWIPFIWFLVHGKYFHDVLDKSILEWLNIPCVAQRTTVVIDTKRGSWPWLIYLVLSTPQSLFNKLWLTIRLNYIANINDPLIPQWIVNSIKRSISHCSSWSLKIFNTVFLSEKRKHDEVCNWSCVDQKHLLIGFLYHEINRAHTMADFKLICVVT